jgi:hypothetical protein
MLVWRLLLHAEKSNGRRYQPLSPERVATRHFEPEQKMPVFNPTTGIYN